MSDYIALDLGQKHTGFARGSDAARLAEALDSAATAQAIAKLSELIDEHDASAVVVGLPRNLSGEDTAQTQWVRQWVERAKTEIERPFYVQDEALTSKLAEAKASSGKNPHDEHSLAAAIIMQDFLDTPEAGRVIW